MDWDQPSEFVVRYGNVRPKPLDLRRAASQAALYGGLAAVIGGVAWIILAAALREPEPRSAPLDDFAPSPPTGFDTTRAVTLCDLNMQAQTARRNNYRSDWTWKTVERGGIVAIRRNFSAVNVMGVPVQGEYTCLVGKDTGQLVGLQFADGGQMVTVPGSELSQQ